MFLAYATVPGFRYEAGADPGFHKGVCANPKWEEGLPTYHLAAIFLAENWMKRNEIGPKGGMRATLLYFGSIRMNILMLDTRNVEQTKDVRMYT